LSSGCAVGPAPTSAAIRTSAATWSGSAARTSRRGRSLGIQATSGIGIDRQDHWQREFEDPIPLPGGRKLVTLRDAADYITGLPKKESDLPEWQTAIEVLMLVSRGGPTMMARIGVMRALNRHVVREFNSDRKEHHWGRRKLKRDA
jgi:hypothetical protein